MAAHDRFSDSSSARRLGILGGGQLAKMIAEAALEQGMQPVVLATSEAQPAAIDGVEVVVGGLDDAAALSEIASRCDLLTLENEFLDLPRLQASLDRHPSVVLRPGVKSIAVAQDKLAQKRLFQHLGIATAEFDLFRPDAVAAELERALAQHPGGVVLKWSRFGYDGRGNLVARVDQQPDVAAVAEFCRRGEERGASLYAERRVDFECELAMVSTRAADGRQVCFPLVVSRQERGVCREVFGPAAAAGHDAELESRAREIMRQIAEELELVGTFAVEFFLEQGGRLLVNEMAPRVHNSGHYTLFGDEPSQFDLHVQAVAGTPLSEPALRGLGVMRNLLGPWDIAAATPCARPDEPPPPGTALEWYGKRTVSPGRKMGHLTGRASSLRHATELMQAMADYEARLWTSMQGAEG